jgi:hypothetical protein
MTPWQWFWFFAGIVVGVLIGMITVGATFGPCG